MDRAEWPAHRAGLDSRRDSVGRTRARVERDGPRGMAGPSGGTGFPEGFGRTDEGAGRTGWTARNGRPIGRDRIPGGIRSDGRLVEWLLGWTRASSTLVRTGAGRPRTDPAAIPCRMEEGSSRQDPGEGLGWTGDPSNRSPRPIEGTRHRSEAARWRLGASQTERAPTRVRWSRERPKRVRGSAHPSERHRSQSQPEGTSHRTNGHHWQSRADREGD